MPNRGPRINPAFVGIIGAAVMFALLFFAFTNVTLFQSTLTMKAQVSSGDTLATGADVEVAGVKVGSVKSVEKGSPGALVTMTVDTKKITMYRDASLQIRPHGVFGPKFVEVNPGTQTAGGFPEGGTVDLKNTSVSVDFEAILNSLDENTRTSLQTFFYEFGTGADNRGQDFGQVIDNLQPVTGQLTPPLQVIGNRSVETGRFFDNNAVVTETYANSPIYNIIHENAIFLGALDNHKEDLAALVVHGNNLLGGLDTVTSGNVGNLRTVLAQLPGFADQLQRFSNDLGYGTNALTPALLPQRGQTQGDIEVAVRRTKDSFGQCDIADNTTGNGQKSDTPHANFTRIVPCTDAAGNPTKDSNGNVAHHHVTVLLGLHLNPAIGPLANITTGDCGILGIPTTVCTPTLITAINQVINLIPALSLPTAEEESSVLCGPNTQNSGRGSNPAFGCQNQPQMSAVIPPAGSAPPPLFGSTSSFRSSSAQSSSSGPGFMASPHQASFSDLLLGH